ncbi:hypothetical protein SCLCIDRAFT_1216932 [Scleroderma citrinum Foug A]|uniref:Uncharacterized protein n=1 Tax=Scleroderma citrinum Foug A TaxID=1036808 RepID=A0A0C2ZF16_9AGAM|nr:hypothetical protein SCLCIDRAFT_1216932 [Scleroderma citrinum Foug A]
MSTDMNRYVRCNHRSPLHEVSNYCVHCEIPYVLEGTSTPTSRRPSTGSKTQRVSSLTPPSC